MYKNNAISANDPKAIEKLTEKKEQCQALQDMMKGVNAHWRKTGTCVGAYGINEEQAKNLDDVINNAKQSWQRVPFPDYTLKNNYAEIKRLEKRIAEMTRNKEVGFSGWEFSGGRADANKELNRLQLFFDEKPSEGQRAQLKSNGFKWAPSQEAWQRQLNSNAIYAANRIDFIKPSDGRTVREHQPKAPVRDAVR
ncbi:MAG: hypothetical protein FWD05_11380 [Oscillospiraceae bacterium]|nr:hypothetical protein [Oscillospiraceae bacterium]